MFNPLLIHVQSFQILRSVLRLFGLTIPEMGMKGCDAARERSRDPLARRARIWIRVRELPLIYFNIHLSLDRLNPRYYPTAARLNQVERTDHVAHTS